MISVKHYEEKTIFGPTPRFVSMDIVAILDCRALTKVLL